MVAFSEVYLWRVHSLRVGVGVTEGEGSIWRVNTERERKERGV